jgi:hypothetical protein
MAAQGSILTAAGKVRALHNQKTPNYDGPKTWGHVKNSTAIQQNQGINL